MKCDDSSELYCDGGYDDNDCANGDFCIPAKGGPVVNIDINGNIHEYECPVSCPTKCSSDEFICNGGKDPSGCPNQDFCWPLKGGPVGKDGNECPILCPMKCDDSSELYCNGGYDDNDCANGDFCIPAKGGPVVNININGNIHEYECPVSCPTKCGSDEFICNGGKDPSGCPNPDFCWPTEGGPVGKDGNPCPPTCPAKCDDSIEMYCPGGEDANGCILPDICVPQKDEGCPMKI